MGKAGLHQRENKPSVAEAANNTFLLADIFSQELPLPRSAGLFSSAVPAANTLLLPSQQQTDHKGSQLGCVFGFLLLPFERTGLWGEKDLPS